MNKKIQYFLLAFAIWCSPILVNAQKDHETTETLKSVFAAEIDPMVPLILHGIGGHLMWQPKQSKHLVFGFAVIAYGTLPDFMINLNQNNKNKGWKYHINQGFGMEAEYYFQSPNIGLFTGIQLFTQEIDLTNSNVPSVNEHRTNTGMAVLTTGYKWYLFKKKHFYLKPWVGFGYSGIIKGAFSSKVIPDTIVGSYEYHIQAFTPFATVHVGYKF